MKGYTQTAQLLLNHSADYNASDTSFGTVAMVSIAHGHLETLKLILEHIASHEGCIRSPRKKNTGPYKRYFQRIVNRHATGLCTAIRNDHKDIAEYFLQNEVNVSIQDHHGRSPLSYAVEKEDVPLVARLLSHGAAVNMADSHKSQNFIVPSLFWTFIQKSVKSSSNQMMTPVMWAAAKGNLTILKSLQEHGGDLKVATEMENNIKEKEKDNNKTEQPKICLSLYLAAKGGHYDCTKYILDHKIAHDHVLNSGWLAMVETVCHGNTQCIEMLLRYGIEPNKNYLSGKWPTILTQAAQLGYSDCISILHNYAADVNQKDDFGFTPLIMSVKEQKYDCCKALLNLGAYINLRSDDYFGGTALFYAAQDGEIDVVQQLLAKGADTNLRNADGETAIFSAAKLGQTDCLEVMLEKKETKVNTTNNHGSTAIVNAIMNRKLDCVKVLLKHGLDMNLCRRSIIFNEDFKWSLNALMHAIREGYTSCMEYLLLEGADPFLTNHAELNSFEFAIKQEKPECLKILLTHCSNNDISISNPAGKTLLKIGFNKRHKKTIINELLLLSMEVKNTDCTQVLLTFGADIDYRNKGHLSCMDIASQQNLFSHIKLLLLYNADVTSYSRRWRDLCSQAGTKRASSLSVETTYRMKEILLAAGCKPSHVPRELEEFHDMLALGHVLDLNALCSKVIRLSMLKDKKGNLFYTVPKLPLPNRIKSYLLYNVSLPTNMTVTY